MPRVIQISESSLGRGRRPLKRMLSVLSACLSLAISLSACGDSNPVESEFPGVEIVMDSAEFSRQPLLAVATIEFLVANLGPGTAYFEGCPDPVSISVERYDADGEEWVPHALFNICEAADTPTQEELDAGQAYEYSFEEEQVGLYQFRVSYGETPDVRDRYFTTSPAYVVR